MLNIRHLFKELASRNKDSGDFHCLVTSLARIVAAKTHSADVERPISIYIKNYFHLSQNMGDLEAFDPSKAAL